MGGFKAALRSLTLLGWAVIIGLVLLLVLLATCSLQASQDAKAQHVNAYGELALSDGRTVSAKEAGAIRDANDAANKFTRDQVKEATDAIRGENDPAVRDADARRRLCNLNPSACAK